MSFPGEIQRQDTFCANAAGFADEPQASRRRQRREQTPFMTKPISRPMHGLLTDYPYVLIVGTAPFG